jgi:sugar lactone lactonase YvrE
MLSGALFADCRPVSAPVNTPVNYSRLSQRRLMADPLPPPLARRRWSRDLGLAMVCLAGTICGCTRQAQNAQNITTVAGNGIAGYSGDGGPAISAELGYVGEAEVGLGIAVDSLGNLYIADTENNRIRKVDTSGRITTVAGNGKEGYSGDGGPATSAELDKPTGVAVEGVGNLVIVDGGWTIRYVIAKTGTIYTLARGHRPSYYGVASNGDGGKEVRALFDRITVVAVDGAGNIYINDGDRIRKVNASTGIITTVAGGGTGCAGQTDPVGDGCLATSAEIGPSALAVDSAGNIYIADYDHECIRKVDAHTDIITTVAGNSAHRYKLEDEEGDDGPATSATFYTLDGIAVDSDGNLYIADSHSFRVRKVTASTGVITRVAGSGPFVGVNGGYSGDGGPATSARLNHPGRVAVDGAGNLYIADVGNHRIRKVAHREAVPAESKSHAPIAFALGLAIGLAGLAVGVWVWRRKVAVQER